ncbi:MAG: DNA polymerase III subunit chi [Rhodocyclaceae bacterium]|nr:DNA polymerase III subunit chi [Rhodocyclaceae bacterium]MCB1961913.1 DNA polymerase III subunit chi [Rhodocyclaceae bacterium]
MTEVHFYHNAHDLLGAACHLTAKAFGAGRKVAVLLPDAEHARALDAMLWTRQPMSFLPHVASASPLAGETPITLATAAPEGGWPHDDVLINLAAELPPQFERFKMLVEVVGTEDHHRQPARERWRHYAAQGMPPTPHNMKG